MKHHVHFNSFILFLCLFFNVLIYGEGFIAGTLVRTNKGLVPIEQLKSEDKVVGYCFKKNKYKETDISLGCKWNVKKYLEITIDGDVINVTRNHKFYLQIKDKWVKAKKLKLGDNLLSASGLPAIIQDIRRINKPAEAYSLRLKKYHNFSVGNRGILAHNFFFIPFIVAFEGLSFTIALPAMIEVFISGIISGTIFYLGNKLIKPTKKHVDRYRELYKLYRQSNNSSSNTQSNQNFKRSINNNNQFSPNNKKPPKDDKDSSNKNSDNGNRKIGNGHVTNKEKIQIAEELGYKRTKDAPFNTHGELAFKKRNTYISFDKDGHNGGFWKMLNTSGDRLGTFDKTLKIKIGG